MNMTQQQKAVLAVIINAVIVGFSPIFVKHSLGFADPLDGLAHRFTISFVAASLLAFPGWARLKAMKKTFLTVVPLALLNPSLFFALQAFGLQHASSAVAGIVQATVPIFTMILAAIFLKERTGSVERLCTLLSVAWRHSRFCGARRRLFFRQPARRHAHPVVGVVPGRIYDAGAQTDADDAPERPDLHDDPFRFCRV